MWLLCFHYIILSTSNPHIKWYQIYRYIWPTLMANENNLHHCHILHQNLSFLKLLYAKYVAKQIMSVYPFTLYTYWKHYNLAWLYYISLSLTFFISIERHKCIWHKYLPTYIWHCPRWLLVQIFNSINAQINWIN